MAGVESAVQIHIDRGDDLNARDASGMTPLMLSAARNKSAICKLLLSAGADHRLLDLSGRTAVQIAIAAGSEAAATILNAVNAQTNTISSLGNAFSSEPATKPAAEGQPPTIPCAKVTALGEPEKSKTSVDPETPTELPTQRRDPTSAPAFDVTGDGEFDLSSWETEEETTRPEADLAIVNSASAVQIAITTYVPIDSSTEWGDIDAYLPEVALPLARAEDAEGRATLRRLLLRAVREGSVPALDVQAQSANEDRSGNSDAATYLTMVINDLGAEIDERFEYFNANESFEVFVDPEETPDEELILEEALAAIDRAASPRHEPLRIYQREFQSLQLLSAEEEVKLARDMEAALDAALEALATWPDGIARTLAAGADAVAGIRKLSSICLSNESESEPASPGSLEADSLVQAELREGEDEDEDEEKTDKRPADASGTTFASALGRLTSLVEGKDGQRASYLEIRQALGELRLNRHFLLELIDTNEQPSSKRFHHAMVDFRRARDRMTEANLKLSFFHAKKYLHSGEPLDDLAQEGNIGLLKAVDRYDWRRGFRFSTYATWWIRQQISRYVAEKVRIIRVPTHIHEKLQRVERLAQDFEKVFSREPTIDELAERVEMPPHKLAALLRIAPNPSSIDEATVDGMIAIDARDAYTSLDPADIVDRIQMNRAVDGYVSSLSTRDHKEERVLRMRFGIGVKDELTLEEIGTLLQVTRERVRQIEAKALRKLKHPSLLSTFSRLALGLRPQENTASNTRDSSDNRPSVSENMDPSAETTQQTSALPPGTLQPKTSPSSVTLDWVLAQAVDLGVAVEDGRDTDSGCIWVSLVATPNSAHRWLERKLVDLGFAFWPGRGYWL